MYRLTSSVQTNLTCTGEEEVVPLGLVYVLQGEGGELDEQPAPLQPSSCARSSAAPHGSAAASRLGQPLR